MFFEILFMGEGAGGWACCYLLHMGGVSWTDTESFNAAPVGPLNLDALVLVAGS